MESENEEDVIYELDALHDEEEQPTSDDEPEGYSLPVIVDPSHPYLDTEGRFKKGNPGYVRKPGSLAPSTKKAQVALFFRNILNQEVPDGRTVEKYIIDRLTHTQSDKVLLQFYELVLNRSYGKVPDQIKLGPDDSAEGILMTIMANRQLEKKKLEAQQEDEDTE